MVYILLRKIIEYYRMENQATITGGITEKFKEIYALILAGLEGKVREQMIKDWKPAEDNKYEQIH